MGWLRREKRFAIKAWGEVREFPSLPCPLDLHFALAGTRWCKIALPSYSFSRDTARSQWHLAK